MDILLVTTFPPERCGVGAYAAQTARALREKGDTVRVLTWGEGEGDIRLPYWPRGRRILEVLRHCRPTERVVLQYMPGFYIDAASRWSQVQSRLAMTRFFRSAPNLEVIVHEQPWYPAHETLGAAGRLLWRLERRQWLAAKDLCFHNEAAVATYRERFQVSGANARLVSHGRDFVPTYRGNRESAQRELRLDSERAIFASVGFITPYKGYEMVLDALAAIPALDCEYHIVGSLHPQASGDDVEYLQQLQQQASGDPRVKFHIEYVDDAAFDRWMCAAHAVLLPYRSSTSSSVLARCHLLGTPAIASRASGLHAELSAADQAVSDAAELAQALVGTVRSARGIVAGPPR